MPRLSLYKPERGQDYTFIDRQISEAFQMGGTDVYLHKYIGTGEGADFKDVTQIQDLLFLENRDRKYDQEIYRIRGIYNVQNIDFNLSQFGLFIDNDTLYMTVHINDFIKYIGRKPLSGDVMELPHLRDEFALNGADVSLPRYYVIEDVGRASEGFSATWYPHLYRIKLKKIMDSQQFADILNKPATDSMGNPSASGDTLLDILSTYQKEIDINNAIIEEADLDTNTAHPYDKEDPNSPPIGKSGYETRHFYTLAVNEQGKTVLNTADSASLLASGSILSTESLARPLKTGYTGYLVGDGFPTNGHQFGHGIQFPELAGDGDYFLRTDFLPNRLFRFNGLRWVRVEDNVRMELSNTNTRQTLKTSFINNTSYLYDQAVSIDHANISANSSVIDTDITYPVTGLYLVFKFETTEIAYTLADYPTMLSDNAGKVRITLPIINTVQQVIPYAGIWKIMFCNGRVEQRQALSKALRPKADL